MEVLLVANSFNGRDAFAIQGRIILMSFNQLYCLGAPEVSLVTKGTSDQCPNENVNLSPFLFNCIVWQQWKQSINYLLNYFIFCHELQAVTLTKVLKFFLEFQKVYNLG